MLPRTSAGRLAVLSIVVVVVVGLVAQSSAATRRATPTLQQKLTNEIAAFEKRPAKLSFPPLAGKVPASKKIDYLECGVAACTTQGQYLQSVASAIGWSVKVIPSGLNPQTVQSAWNVVIRDHPDAVVESGGFPNAWYASQLAQAAAANIPVISVGGGSPGSGITAAVGANDYFGWVGNILADLITVKSHAAGKVLFAYAPVFTVHTYYYNVYKARMAKVCPKCTTIPLQITPGPNQASQIVGALRANPSVKYLVIYSSLGIGLPAALSSGGIDPSKLFIISQGTSGVTDQLKSGFISEATPYSPLELEAIAIDRLLRYFNHQSFTPAYARYSYWLVTPKSMPAPDALGNFANVPNTLKLFKKVWHVG